MWIDQYEVHHKLCSNVDVLVNNSTAHKIIRKKTDTKLGMQEVAILKRINEISSNAYPRMLDYEATSTHVMLYLTLIEGKTLNQMFEEGELHYSGEYIVKGAIEALVTLHNAGIIHRDIKPENLMIDEQGRVFILDFSSAVIKGSPNAQMNNQGTWGYIAPEILFSKTVADEKTDYFALGMSLKGLYRKRIQELSMIAIDQIEMLTSIQPQKRKINESL